ncbi:MAP kinase phosphatase with leucine-rich repeats protein 3-like [Haliotis asinina]|uniref:MAP kinase phosphatase with leucine-rich repeats protein 3-like n=1 Tax=Haliotis asinina TaxID=109174 RepID=UPI0035319AE7
MARRVHGDHMTLGPMSRAKKQLTRTLAVLPGLANPYPGMDDVTRDNNADKVIIRRRLSRADTLAGEEPVLEKTPSKNWKRLLRRQRTMGDIGGDLQNKPSRGKLNGLLVRLDRAKTGSRLTRSSSISGSYPDISHLHVSLSQSTWNEGHGCNIPEAMEFDESGGNTADSKCQSRGRNHLSLQQGTNEAYGSKTGTINVLEKAPGMQLRSGNIIQSSKFEVNGRSDNPFKIHRRATNSLPSYSKILEFLYLGSIEAAYNEPLLCKLDVQVLVDLSNVPSSQVPVGKKTTCPCLCRKQNHFRSRLNVGIDDIEWENISQYFSDINNFIEGARKCNKHVLVYSYHGKSRAAAVIIQYIMQHFRLSLKDAHRLVATRRPGIAVNTGFWRSLQRFEKQIQESGVPFRNPNNEPGLAVGPPRIRDAWTETF